MNYQLLIFVGLIYLAAGVTLVLLILTDTPIGRGRLSEISPVVLAFVFASAICWPLMLLAFLGVRIARRPPQRLRRVAL